MEDEYCEEVHVDDDEVFSSDSDIMEEEAEPAEDDNDTSFFSAQLPDSALCVAISTADPFISCVGCLDNSARLFQVDAVGAPQQSAQLLGHTDSVASVSFSSHGGLVATGSYDGTIKLWSAIGGETFGEEICTIDETSSDIESLMWHPDGLVLVCGCADGSIWVWDILPTGDHTLKYMMNGHSHGSPVRSLHFLGKHSSELLSTSEEGVAIVWNLATGQVIHKTQPFAEPISSASVHPNKPVYALGLENGWTYVMHAQSGKQLHKMKTTGDAGSVEAVSFSNCGQLLAAATINGVLEIWHMDHLGGHPRHRIDKSGRTDEDADMVGFTKLVWHPDSSLRCLISGGKAGEVDVWNAMTGEHLTGLAGHSADVLDLAMTQFQDPQGRSVARVVSVCDEGFIKMFTVSQE